MGGDGKYRRGGHRTVYFELDVGDWVMDLN
jgi:hypothetical protein